MFGLNHVIFRPHNVYGEYQNIGDRYRNVVGIFMNQLMQGEPLTVFGDGNQTRAFSYIADVAPYIAASIDVPDAYNEVFNIGADQPFSVNELASRVAEAMGTEATIRHLPARNEVVDAVADHSKAQRVFDMTPPLSLEEGLGRMAEWAKRVGPRRGDKFGDIELTRGLPPVWLEA
jgi:UDP-glucose 4-epimerase